MSMGKRSYNCYHQKFWTNRSRMVKRGVQLLALPPFKYQIDATRISKVSLKQF